MKHDKIKEIIREKMRERCYEVVPPNHWLLPRRGLHLDDVFVPEGRLEKDSPIGPRTGIIMEYKSPLGLLYSLQGIGQVLYYSSILDIENCCLVIPEEHYFRGKRAFSRVPWVGIITYTRDKEFRVQHWPDHFNKTRALLRRGDIL